MIWSPISPFNKSDLFQCLTLTELHNLNSQFMFARCDSLAHVFSSFINMPLADVWDFPLSQKYPQTEKLFCTEYVFLIRYMKMYHCGMKSAFPFSRLISCKRTTSSSRFKNRSLKILISFLKSFRKTMIEWWDSLAGGKSYVSLSLSYHIIL